MLLLLCFVPNGLTSSEVSILAAPPSRILGEAHTQGYVFTGARLSSPSGPHPKVEEDKGPT